MAYDKRSLDDYVDVAERISEFRDKHPAGTLRGTWQMLDVGGQAIVAYRAEAFRAPDDEAPGIGCAWELVPGRTPYTRGSELQNAETSAWGRAIIAVGAADAKRGIASRQEVANARARQESRDQLEDEAAYRAQRNRPPETRADGSATDAELTRMTRGREPGTQRYNGPPPDEEAWQTPAEEQAGSIAPQQKTAMFAQFRGFLGMHDKDAQLDFIEKIVGHRPESRNDLTYVEAAKVLEALAEKSRANA